VLATCVVHLVRSLFEPITTRRRADRNC
jgi:hypothetical protein